MRVGAIVVLILALGLSEPAFALNPALFGFAPCCMQPRHHMGGNSRHRHVMATVKSRSDAH